MIGRSPRACVGAHISDQFRTPCSWSPAGQTGRALLGGFRVLGGLSKGCCPGSSGGCGYGGDRSVGAASLGRIGRPTPSDIRHRRRGHQLPLCLQGSLWGPIQVSSQRIEENSSGGGREELCHLLLLFFIYLFLAVLVFLAAKAFL